MLAWNKKGIYFSWKLLNPYLIEFSKKDWWIYLYESLGLWKWFLWLKTLYAWIEILFSYDSFCYSLKRELILVNHDILLDILIIYDLSFVMYYSPLLLSYLQWQRGERKSLAFQEIDKSLYFILNLLKVTLLIWQIEWVENNDEYFENNCLYHVWWFYILILCIMSWSDDGLKNI